MVISMNQQSFFKKPMTDITANASNSNAKQTVVLSMLFNRSSHTQQF